MATKKKNSLVENINRRKRAGTSRRKSASTIAPAAYAAMEAGWSKKARVAKKKKSPKKSTGRAHKKTARPPRKKSAGAR